MRTRLHLRTIAFGLLVCLAVLVPASAQKTKLSRVQVQQLIQNHAPDDLIASQLRSRGISFPIDRKTLDEFAAKGAGPKTLSVLSNQIREGNVEVHTEPGSTVILDGKEAGTAGFFGARARILRIENVAEGKHELTARKTGYQDAQVSFTLANKEDKQLSLPLEWLGGYLSVSAQPSDAAIKVTGPSTFDVRTMDDKCQPGNYTVTTSLEGYVSQTRTFQVGAGEHHTEKFQLAADPAVVTSLLSDAKAKLYAGNFTGAVESARKLIKLTPGEAKAEEILAEASFQTGDLQVFLDAGIKAIHAGGTVTVPLMHVHSFPHRMIHRTTITISSSGISVEAVPQVNGCKFPPSIVFSQLSQVELRGQSSAIQLHIAYLSKTPDKIKLIGSLHDLDFVVDGTAVNSQPGGPLIQSPENAEQALRSVAGLIKQASGK